MAVERASNKLAVPMGVDEADGPARRRDAVVNDQEPRGRGGRVVAGSCRSGGGQCGGRLGRLVSRLALALVGDLAVEGADARAVEPNSKERAVPVSRVVRAIAVAANWVSIAPALSVRNCLSDSSYVSLLMMVPRWPRRSQDDHVTAVRRTRRILSSDECSEQEF